MNDDDIEPFRAELEQRGLSAQMAEMDGQVPLATMRVMMTKLKLTVNETKTRVAKLPEEKFDFLGYSFGRCYSPKTRRA